MENLDILCKACKLSFWKWDIANDEFTMSGYFDSFKGSHQDFINLIDAHDRTTLEKIFLEFNETKLSFEKKFRVHCDFAQRVLMRGQIDNSAFNKAQGVLIDITHNNSDETEFSVLTHDLTQSLMVINTYVNGCLYRLKESTIDPIQLTDIMNTMKHHSALLGDKIHELKNFMRPI